MDVVVLRLLNGDEVIGQTRQKTGDSWTLEKPVGIRVMQSNDGKPQLGFFDFVPLMASSGIPRLTFRDDHVIFHYKPVIEVINLYNQHFGSGLVQATSLSGLPPIKQ